MDNGKKGKNIKKLVIAISGASGAIYGIKVLSETKKSKIETHLIISKWAKVTIETETEYTFEQVKEMADYCYEDDDLAAVLASGSFKWDGMVIAPCSMKTLAGIAHGYSEDLIIRTADVAIKEHRKLILVARETPLNAIHLENMLKLSRLGVTIMPPAPAFYTKPMTIDDLVAQTVGRIFDQLGIEVKGLQRWQGNR